jgi:hypothetical protein
MALAETVQYQYSRTGAKIARRPILLHGSKINQRNIKMAPLDPASKPLGQFFPTGGGLIMDNFGHSRHGNNFL